ncbi:MAG: ABC transporter ATP-binding protein [Arachnia sp.]
MSARTPPRKGLALPALGETMLETRGLSKVYRVGESRLAALNRVTLAIPRGSFTAVVGTSGSGKSTLLNMLAGLERPTAGEIYVGGKPLHTLNESQLVTYRRDNVGFIFQSFNLMPHLSALQNVALPLSFRGVPKSVRLRRAHVVLNQMGLAKHVNHKPTQLSGGQQQRVGIARALVSQPPVVFADEPTGNLDSRTATATLGLIRTVIKRYQQTWVMVTHDAHLASFADTIVSISDGRISDVTHTEHHPKAAS